MPNECVFSMLAVAEEAESLKRFAEILRYEDSEYFIYRCLIAECSEIKKQGNLFSIRIDGEVAWSCARWFDTKEDKDKLCNIGTAGHNSVCGTAQYITLDLLCQQLKIGLELYSQEPFGGFQEHYLINGKGEVICRENVSWGFEEYDENWDLLDTPVECGGFDNYAEFKSCDEIYLIQPELPKMPECNESGNRCKSPEIFIVDKANECKSYNGRKDLDSVIIPDGVMKIGNSAFAGCVGLRNIIIPNSVTKIEGSAFRDCIGLRNIIIPNSVTKIEGYAFRDCTGLNRIMIPDSVAAIGGGAFFGCTSLTSIVLPNGITAIGNSTFSGCTGLTEIIIPDGVTSIGTGAFFNCSGLTEIVIPDGITKIEEATFSGCTGLVNIVIPYGVTIIGNNAFWGCAKLTSIALPDGVTKIGDSAFGACTRLSCVVICNGVTEIGAYAFCDCTGLTSIVIPDSVTKIGKNAFGGCGNLHDIQASPKLKEIIFDQINDDGIPF